MGMTNTSKTNPKTKPPTQKNNACFRSIRLDLKTADSFPAYLLFYSVTLLNTAGIRIISALFLFFKFNAVYIEYICVILRKEIIFHRHCAIQK